MSKIIDSPKKEIEKLSKGLLYTLLEPHINKLKEKIKNSSIKTDTKPENLSKLLESYLSKLAIKVNEVTSIAFPQQKFSLSDIYEPLTLESKNSKDPNISVDFLVDSDLRNNFLIIDEAGMGKSTFSKYIVHELLYKNARFPVLYELRKLDCTTSLIENLVQEFDFNQSNFSRDIFHELLNEGIFFIILDGFDEVPLDCQRKVSEEIHELSINVPQNKLIVTSRHQELLPDISNVLVLEFLKMSKEKSISLMNRYDKVTGHFVGQKLAKEIDRVPDRFLETPLLVTLLYQAYGINNSIEDRMCTFYSDLFNALYKGHDLTNKNGYCREKKSCLGVEDFKIMTSTLSYIMMLKKVTSFRSEAEALQLIKKASEMCNIELTKPTAFLNDLLVAVPLMQKDGNEIRFAHKTILEYFTAEYIVFHNRSLEILEKIYKSAISRSFDVVYDFLAELNPLLFDSVIPMNIAKEIKDSGICKGSNSSKVLLESVTYSSPIAILF